MRIGPRLRRPTGADAVALHARRRSARRERFQVAGDRRGARDADRRQRRGRLGGRPGLSVGPHFSRRHRARESAALATWPQQRAYLIVSGVAFDLEDSDAVRSIPCVKRRAALAAVPVATGAFPRAFRTLPAKRARPDRLADPLGLTEDLFALGAGSRVVGVSQFTDYPPAARGLPQIASFSNVWTPRQSRCLATRFGCRDRGSSRGGGRTAPSAMRLRSRTLQRRSPSIDIFGIPRQRLGAIGSRAAMKRGRVTRATPTSRKPRSPRTDASTPRGTPGRSSSCSGVAPIYASSASVLFITTLIRMAGGRNAARLVYIRPTAPTAPRRSSRAQPMRSSCRILRPGLARARSETLEPWRSLRAVRRRQPGYIARSERPIAPPARATTKDLRLADRRFSGACANVYFR